MMMMMTATTTTTTTITSAQNTTAELPGSSPASDWGTRDISDSDNDSDSNTPSENQPRPAEPATIAAAEPRKFLAWRMPWRIALVLFSVYFALWAYMVVVQRYWVKENWDAALPGLGTRCVFGFLSFFGNCNGPAVSYHVQQYSNTAPKLSLLLL